MKFIKLNQVSSTNDYARELLEKGEITETTVIYSPSQTNGKGMGSNRWQSEDGKNATFSIVVFPDISTENVFTISLATSMAIYDYMETRGIKTSIKWPNDVYYNNKKLGGILVENKIIDNKVAASIIGVGININQTEFCLSLPNPVSMSNITTRVYDVDEEINDLCCLIEDRILEFKDQNFSDIRLKYLFKLYKFGKIAMWNIEGIDNEIAGTIVDVKPSGKLVIQAITGQLCVLDFKQVKYVDD